MSGDVKDIDMSFLGLQINGRLRSPVIERGDKDRWRSTSLVLYRQQKQQEQEQEDQYWSLPRPGKLRVNASPSSPSVRPFMGAAARKVARVRKRRPKSLPPGVQLIEQHQQQLVRLPASMSQKQQRNLTKLVTSHPVLSIVLSCSEAINSIPLLDFVEQYQGRRLPYTFTEFFSDYLSFLVVQHLQYSRGQNAPQHLRWNTQETLEQLARVAFVNYVHGTAITYTMLEKNLPSDRDLFDVYNQSSNTGFKPDMIFRTLGLLEISSAEHKQVHYQFREPYVQEFLVAQHLAQEVLRRNRLAKTSLVSSALRDAMRKLPGAGQIWRMAFGLLSGYASMEVQRDLLHAVIKEAKQLTSTVRPFDITSLCVEATYESQNQGELTELLDDFTLNQTLNYSNVYISPARLPYAVSAVGYLVRASPDVYGVHLSNFALNASNIGMLADPVNEISDNNLEVLNLSHNNIGTSGMKRLQRFIVKATNLTHLDLSHCQLGNTATAMLSEFFMCVPLSYLRLTANRIGDPGLMQLASNLKFLPTLEWLDLSENCIGDYSAVHLADALPVLPNLRSLDLSKNLISDSGCEAITRELSQLNKITSLMLSDNQISPMGIDHASKHVWKSRSLRFMNISLNHLTEGGILGLRRAANSHGSLKIELASDGESMLITPDDQTDMGEGDLHQSVDLLAGRADRRLPCEEEWPADHLRRSWHGMPNGLNNNNSSKRPSTLYTEE